MQKRFTPPRSTAEKPMSKAEFMQRYVLNRALTADNLNGDVAAKEAEKAWRTIESACKQ
jgi:hypothetical protein